MTGMADPRAAEQLSQMIRGSWISQIVGTLAQLEIADHLARRPQESGILAEGIGCNPDATLRLLRAAVNVGLVSMLPDGRFGLTPMGELLRSNVPGSLRDSAIALTAPGHWLPWGRLAEVVRQKERTDEEAAIARAVNEFLQDLLGQADIRNQQLLADGGNRNRNITVGELLDRAAKTIEGKFAGQPLTEAAIRQTLGDAYRGLGRFDEAKPHLERALQLCSAQLGPDHPFTGAAPDGDPS